MSITAKLEENEPILLTVPVPRAALHLVAPPPVLLSQRNVEQVTGIPADSYLRMLRSADFDVPILSEGKLRLVNREAFVAWLEMHRKAPARTLEKNAARPTKVHGGDDADAILRSVGAKPTRRTRCRA